MDFACRALVLAGIGIGLSLAGTGALAQQPDTKGIGPAAQFLVRVAVPGICVLAAGWAVASAPQSVIVVGTAALWAALAAAALDPAWDALRLLFLVASAVAACAAFLLLLPVPWRRLAVSLLILFHFCGIFCAVMTAPRLERRLPG